MEVHLHWLNLYSNTANEIAGILNHLEYPPEISYSARIQILYGYNKEDNL
jgi:hypothetical protein